MSQRSRWGRSRARLAAVLASGALAACGQATAELRGMGLTQVRPSDLSSVALNQPIVLHFSEDLDPASVNHTSFRVRSLDGRAASGTRDVAGNRLSFVPDPVLARDLSDGGYRPDTTYRVELAGFPRPEGLRARNGAHLERSVTLEFHTVSPLDEDRLPFLDTTPTTAGRLKLRGVVFVDGPRRPRLEVTPTVGFFLDADEPIDPASVPADGVPGLELTALPSGESISLRAVLLDNDDPNAWPPRGKTTLQLVPSRPLEVFSPRGAPGGRYRLRQDRSQLPFRDFSGNPMLIFLPERTQQVWAQELRQINAIGKASSSKLEDSYLEEFIGVDQRSNAAVPEVDGTALWSGNGRIELRYPRSAGTGEDGEVSLAGKHDLRDLHASRLVVREDEVCELSSVSGLVVLRAQGRMSIEGRLVRQAAGPALVQPRAGETVSAFLDRAREAGTTATVLIAGGDLWIRGQIDVAGPLILVAGGRVRVSGRLTVPGRTLSAGYFARLGDAPVAGLLVEGADERQPSEEPKVLGLEIEPPPHNPLATPLRFVVRSNAIPTSHSDPRWQAAPEVHGYAGAGSYAVKYLGDRPRPGAPGRYEEVLREDPALLGDSSGLRLWVELEVSPGPTWDPPWVDSVRVTWDIPEE